MTSLTIRERLVTAAFALFEEQGFEQTTVEDIARRAGVGRTTFFRTFKSKDDVVFPDHDVLVERVRLRLTALGPASAIAAARAAAQVVVGHFIDEGELAESRYRLTSTIASLRDREVASVSRYQRVLCEHLRTRTSDDIAPLQAELLAACWVTLHNHVLRRWLRGTCADPMLELAEELEDVFFRLTTSPTESPATTVAVFQTSRSAAAILPALKAALGEPLKALDRPERGSP